MRIDRFQMERTQSLYENEVRWNLSESGVLPLRVEELLEGDAGRGEFLERRSSTLKPTVRSSCANGLRSSTPVRPWTTSW